MTLNSFTTDKPVVLGFQIELEFGNAGLRTGEKREDPEKNLSEQDENQQQSQPTCDARRSRQNTAQVV